jgi:hypothetical protein
VKRVRTASGWYRDEAEPAGAGGRLAILAGGFIAGAVVAAVLIFWFLTRPPHRHRPMRTEPPVPREMIKPLFLYGSLTGGFAGLTAAGFYLVWFRREQKSREEGGAGGE